MKKMMLLTATTITILSAFSCKKSANAPSNSASVMVVNGCAGTSGINATASGTAVNNSTNLLFLKNSGYQYVSASSAVSFAFILNGLGTPLSSGNVDLTANGHYTVFAGGIITNPSFVSTPDDLTVVSGMAKVRFVNLSPDNYSESCYVGNQLVSSGVSYKTVTSFNSISPVSGANVQMQYDPGSPNPVLVTSLTGVTFSAGKIYTVILTGTNSGSGVSGLTLSIITNNN